MINYEAEDSPFFILNKNYCELVEQKLKTLHFECTGFCNEDGYSVEAACKKDPLTYHFLFYKNNKNCKTEITISGLDKSYYAEAGEDALQRVPLSLDLKKLLPEPYFVKINETPDRSVLDELVKIVQFHHIAELRLKDGILYCVIPDATNEPLTLLMDIKAFLKEYDNSFHE